MWELLIVNKGKLEKLKIFGVEIKKKKIVSEAAAPIHPNTNPPLLTTVDTSGINATFVESFYFYQWSVQNKDLTVFNNENGL